MERMEVKRKMKTKTEKELEKEIEEIYIKDTFKQIKNLLDIIKDPLEQLSSYIAWIVRIKYLIELKICWELQGFDSYFSWKKIHNISYDLTKQEFNETQKKINGFRRSKDYEKEMKEIEKEII